MKSGRIDRIILGAGVALMVMGSLGASGAEVNAGTDREEQFLRNRERFQRWYHRMPGAADSEAPSPGDVANSLREDLQTIASNIRDRQISEKTLADTWAVDRTIDARTRLRDGRVTELVSLNGGIQFYITHNAVAADTTSTDELWPGGGSSLDLTGQGVAIGLWDAGDVRTSHDEFGEPAGPRVADYDGSSPLGISDHATHVAGTLAAAGKNAAARGMAPAASLDAYDWTSDLGEMGLAGLMISNHSYSYQTGWGTVAVQGVATPAWFGNTAISQTEDFRFGFYRQVAAEIDRIVYNAQTYLPVWAVGNERGSPGEAPIGHESGHYAYDGTSLIWTTGVTRPDDGDANGYDTIPENGVAKNILTVGAVADIPGGYQSPADVMVSAFSSFGPTDDGRIKPDLVANGEGVLSTFSGSNDEYAELPGTSVASPNVAGSLALLIERHFRDASAPMWSSTLRGLAIHTADEAGDGPGPDYRHGWGLLNAERAAGLQGANFASGTLAHVKEVALPDSDFIEFPVECDGSEALKVTISWNDPPGFPMPDAIDPLAPMLVNDLDLRVRKGVAVFEPWILDPAAPYQSAVIGDNIRDNVEQVVINAPEAGEYLVRVTHKGALVDADAAPSFQNVSVLISGNVASGLLIPEIVDVAATGDEEVTLLWKAIVGRSYRVQRADDIGLGLWADVGGVIQATKYQVAAAVPALPEAGSGFFRVVENGED